jgi:hypothetical protein
MNSSYLNQTVASSGKMRRKSKSAKKRPRVKSARKSNRRNFIGGTQSFHHNGGSPLRIKESPRRLIYGAMERSRADDLLALTRHAA